MFTLSRFEFGACAPLRVRHEYVSLGLRSPIRLLYASDLHLGWPWSNPVIPQLLQAAQIQRPQAIVLGGDLVDRTRGLDPLRHCLARLVAVAPVYALAGNHDHRFGNEAVRSIVESAGGVWLSVDRHAAPIRLGAELSLGATVQTHPTPGVHQVLCGHDPAVYRAAREAGYRVVLAGHLHGGQCVLATYRGRLYPGAWFARWTGLRFQDGDTTMLVSRGAADSLPVRWNCPREVIVCEIV